MGVKKLGERLNRTRDRTQKMNDEKFKIKRRGNKIRKMKKDLWRTQYEYTRDFKTGWWLPRIHLICQVGYGMPRHCPNLYKWVQFKL
jgi:hypothetical protein